MDEFRDRGGNPENMDGRKIPVRNYVENFPDGSRKMLEFHTPPQQSFDNEEMRGSMQHILAENIGEFVVVEFLIGTEIIMRKQGILYFVGRSFVTLYDDELQVFIVCDIFSIKFVYFYLPSNRPTQRNLNILPNNSGNNGNRSRSI